MSVRMIPGSMALVAAVCFGLSAVTIPSGVEGQEAAGQVVAGESEERLETYALVYLGFAEVRNELHQELAQTHQVGVREEVRERAEERMAEILREHGVTAQEYEQFTFAVSADGERRERFEAVLQRLREGTNGNGDDV